MKQVQVTMTIGQFVRVMGMVLLLGWSGSAVTHAKTRYREAFLEEYPSASGTILDDQVASSSRREHCGVCHFDFGGGGNRDPYGLDVQANLSLGAQAAVRAIRSLDSDEDGFSNETEILDTTGFDNRPTFPGLTRLCRRAVLGPYILHVAGRDGRGRHSTLLPERDA